MINAFEAQAIKTIAENLINGSVENEYEASIIEGLLEIIEDLEKENKNT